MSKKWWTHCTNGVTEPNFKKNVLTDLAQKYNLLNVIRQSRQRAVRAICTWLGQRLKSSINANLSVILEQHR